MSDADQYAQQLEEDLERATKHALWLTAENDRLLAEKKAMSERLWMLENFVVHKGYDLADALMESDA